MKECSFCRKITQSAYDLNEGVEVNQSFEGEAFIDLLGDLIVHINDLQGSRDVEAALHINYCPWCGQKIERLSKWNLK